MGAVSLLLLLGSAGLHVVQHVLLKRARNRTAFVWCVWLWAAVVGVAFLKESRHRAPPGDAAAARK